MKLLEENARGTLEDISIGDDFLEETHHSIGKKLETPEKKDHTVVAIVRQRVCVMSMGRKDRR